ncbi:MAG: AAA family ATPase [Lachnospiraceae bacterium]|nr:AAA family ATPase [Lachnospiraceae bacterium]
MADTIYPDEKLFELGRVNYDKLVLYCTGLEEKGLWAQAEKVMKQSSTEVLDLYVQSVLMNLAVHCGEILDSQREFMRVITVSNPLGIPKEGRIKRSVYNDSKRLYELPPVLLQLCGLYDKEHKGDMTMYFLDAFLNILLCMAYLNRGKDMQINVFIQKYYEKISNFIIDQDIKRQKEYIKRKLMPDGLNCSINWTDAKEDKEKDIENRNKEAENDTAKNKEVKPPVKRQGRKTKKQQEVIKKETINKQEKKSKQNKSNIMAAKAVIESQVAAEEKKQKEDRKQKEEEKRRLKEAFFKRVEEDARLAKEREEKLAKEKFLAVKKRLEERERAEQEEQERQIKEILGELNSLVGLSDVKGEIQSLTNLIKIRKLREKMQMPVMDMSYHMVFTGNPGTGKTTVARIVGRIYKALGILSDGKMVETDRSGLVAGYVGQTAIKVHEIIEQAIGGVLFIDEAYSLVNPDVPNDFGSEAVDALVKLMEDHRDNLVIIVAGYTDEMKTFLKSNTGLISRFNKFINFPDYSRDELIDIMEVMADGAGLKIEEEAKELVQAQLGSMEREEWEDFGNARGIRNMFEKIVTNQANRLVQIGTPTKEQLMTIVAQDVTG